MQNIILSEENLSLLREGKLSLESQACLQIWSAEQRELAPTFLNSLKGNMAIKDLTIWMDPLENMSNPFSVDSIDALGGLLKGSDIRSLKLIDTKIGSRGAQALAPYLEDCNLEKLDLAHNNILDEGAIAIAIALPRTHIRILNLEHNYIGDIGMRPLSSSLKDSYVTELNLQDNKMTECGAIFAGNLPGAKLTKLHLGGNPLKSNGLKAIISALKYVPIESLDLSYSGTWDGAYLLAELINHRPIKAINIEESCIGDMAPLLQAIRDNENLVSFKGGRGYYAEEIARLVEGRSMVLDEPQEVPSESWHDPSEVLSLGDQAQVVDTDR